MYKLKQQPEDFIVTEISTIQPTSGEYALFTLKKKNYTTIRALEQLSTALHKPLKAFGFAGSKDRQAITEQTCSAKGVSKAALENIALKDITLTYLGQLDRPVSLGQLEGNHFAITVRNIDALPKAKTTFINLFGEQRFSTNNAAIGKALVKRDFKKATELVLENTGEAEQRVQAALEQQPNNYLAALKQIPKLILRLYIHAYQSELWNRTAAETAKTTHDPITIPLIGFGTTGKQAIVQAEGITPRDFIIKELPELSSEGSERELYATAEEVEIGKLENDELNEGKKKVLLKFKLGKGCYATEFIRQLFAAP